MSERTRKSSALLSTEAVRERAVLGALRRSSQRRSDVEESLDELAGLLWKGPRFADVRGVEEQEAGVQNYSSFHIEG